MANSERAAPQPKHLEEQVKCYYRHTENYDWTRAVDKFIGLETIFHRARLRKTCNLLKQLEGGERYLDVGCGTAMITRFLPEGAVGIDLKPRNLERARPYAAKARFLLCDAEGTIPLRDESFEVAVCTEMLEHLLYPLRALSDVYSVLKPKGILVGSVPGRSPIWKLRWMSSSRQNFTGEPYDKHYDQEEVKTLLSRYFHIRKLYSRYFQMNWYFLVIRKEAV